MYRIVIVSLMLNLSFLPQLQAGAKSAENEKFLPIPLPASVAAAVAAAIAAANDDDAGNPERKRRREYNKRANLPPKKRLKDRSPERLKDRSPELADFPRLNNIWKDYFEKIHQTNPEAKEYLLQVLFPLLSNLDSFEQKCLYDKAEAQSMLGEGRPFLEYLYSENHPNPVPIKTFDESSLRSLFSLLFERLSAHSKQFKERGHGIFSSQIQLFEFVEIYIRLRQFQIFPFFDTEDRDKIRAMKELLRSIWKEIQSILETIPENSDSSSEHLKTTLKALFWISPSEAEARP